MKTSTTAVPIRIRTQERQRMEGLLSRHLTDLFIRVPTLLGFRLRDDLTVADLAVLSWPDITPPESVNEFVMQSLLQLAECHPEAVLIMRGRTFVRSLH